MTENNRGAEHDSPGAPSRSSLPLIARIASHTAVWLSLLVPTIVVLARGWIPTGDDAAIAFRALQTFSLHPPSVGLPSTAGLGLGHYVYDPGPLLFWLLAIPVRIDHAHGALWGAAVIAAAVMSVAVEALFRRGAWIGCLLISLGLVDIAWLAPQVFENLVWNAYFPIPMLIAGIAFAWLVATGSFGWWPVLVFVASVAAQCHLIYALPAVGLALGAPVIGVLVDGRPARSRWLVGGLVVGLLCWIGPLLQELGSNGNLSAIASANGGRPTLGLGYGLRALARATSPHPIWTIRPPATGIGSVSLAGTSSPITGLAVLAVLAAVAVLTLRRRQREPAALDLLTLIVAIALVVSFTVFPSANVASIFYLDIVLWVVGPAVWVSVLWGLWAMAGDALAHRGRLAPPATALGAALVALTAVAVVVGLHQDAAFQPSLLEQWNPAMAAQIRLAATRVEASVPGGPVLARTGPRGTDGGLVETWTEEGLAWQLDVDGWKPGFFSVESAYTGLELPAERPFYRVLLTFDGKGITSSEVAFCHLGQGRFLCAPVPASRHPAT